MSLWESIILEKVGDLAWVTLNRPQVLNAYNIKMRDELYEVLAHVESDPEVLAVIFRGAGERAFCAGADLTEFGSAPSQAIARQVRFERDVWSRFINVSKPLIAAVHGYCLGSGMEIALCCDLRIASSDAQFGLPEPGLGMIPAAAGTQTLPRVTGRARALMALLAAERIDAMEAYRVGLVNRVVPKESLFEEATALGTGLASLDPAVLRLAKETVNRGLDTTLEQGLKIESAAALRLAASRA